MRKENKKAHSLLLGVTTNQLEEITFYDTGIYLVNKIWSIMWIFYIEHRHLSHELEA